MANIPKYKIVLELEQHYGGDLLVRLEVTERGIYDNEPQRMCRDVGLKIEQLLDENFLEMALRTASNDLKRFIERQKEELAKRDDFRGNPGEFIRRALSEWRSDR